MKAPPLIVMLGLILFTIPAGTASADLPILVSPASGSATVRNNGTGNFGGMIGYKFQSNSAATINALGIWDGPTESEAMGLGLETGIEIGIWNADTEILLGSTLLGSGTSAFLLDEFRYGAIGGGAIDLMADTDYVVAAMYITGGNAFLDGVNAFAPNSGISGSGSLFASGGTFGLPGNAIGANFRFVGPNAAFIAAIPEPSTALLLALGLGSLAAVRRPKTALAA